MLFVKAQQTHFHLELANALAIGEHREQVERRKPYRVVERRLWSDHMQDLMDAWVATVHRRFFLARDEMANNRNDTHGGLSK